MCTHSLVDVVRGIDYQLARAAHFHKKGRRCQQGPSPSYSDPLLCGCVVESTSCDSCSAGKPEIPPRLFLCLGFSPKTQEFLELMKPKRYQNAASGGPGQSSMGPGRSSKGFCDFKDVPNAKGVVTFEVPFRLVTNFLQCCFSMVF